MRDPHTDNILSAYLDGELSEQERHEVERRLAGDPAARRLLDEFRTIRAALQGIPRQSLGPSFRDRVLERVEDAVGHPADQGTQRLPVPQTRERRLPIGRLWRAIVWPAMAVAVAVLVMVFHSEPGGPRGQLAQRPDQVARGRVEPDKMASDGKVLKKDNSTAAPSASTPSEAPPPAAVGRTRIGPVALSSPPATPPVAEPPALRAAGQSADVAAGRSASTERVAGVPAEVSVAPSPVAVVRADRDRAPHADRDEQVTQPDSDANEHLVIVRLVVDRPAVARRTLAKMFDRRQIVRAERSKAHFLAWSSQLERARVDGSLDQPAESEEEA
ncbi:MAG: zf-HC2 domain-containing protein, partial [Pirellulales bacterium]